MGRTAVIEIFAPTEGLHQDLSPSMITPRSTPNVGDCNAYYGMVQKDYGTTLFATGSVGNPVNYIYEAVFPEQAILQVFTHTAMFKYASGTFASDGQAYNGTYVNFWNGCMHNGEFVYTNGVDLLQYKASYTATGTVMGGVATDSFKTYALVSYKDHLNMYHTYESGTECYKRVRWTKAGTLNHTRTDWTTAGSGFLDVQDAEGAILTAEKLGDGTVAIYAENSVHVQNWVGGTTVYQFDKKLSNVDIPSRRCVASKGGLHYVVARNGVYEYSGGSTWKEISAPIRPDFTTIVNASNMHYSFAQYIDFDDELRVYVPTGTATQPNTCYICKLSDNYAWYKLTRGATAKGVSARPSSLTIGQLQGNVGAQNWKFGDMRLQAGQGIHLVGDSSGYVQKMDKSVYSVISAGTASAQSFVFDTKDFSAYGDIDPLTKDRFNITRYMDSEVRWLRIKAEIKGNGSALASYSDDGGASFTPCAEGAKAVTANWDKYEWDLDHTHPRLTIRFSNSGINEVIHVRHIKVEYIPLNP